MTKRTPEDEANTSLTAAILAQASQDPYGVAFMWVALNANGHTGWQRSRKDVISDAMEIAHGLRCLLQETAGLSLRQNVVGVAIREGYDLLLCQLALLLSGNIYVPVDLKDPRTGMLLSDCNPRLIITPEQVVNEKTRCQFPYQFACVSDLKNRGAASERVLQASTLIEKEGADDLSHIFYTSGTSGSPKGVIVRRSSLAAYAYGRVKASRLDKSSRVFSASAFTFDPNYGDAVSSLLAGSILCAATRHDTLTKLTKCLSVLEITHVCMTPTLWALRGKLDEGDVGDGAVPSILPCLKELALGGEKMHAELVEHARKDWKSGVRLVNTYGLTECTVYQTYAVLNEAHDLETQILQSLVGLPYPGLELGLKISTSVYWLGEDNEALKNGCQGEIVIRGDQVANGYVSAKNSRYLEMGGRRAFATGDLAAVCVSKTYGKSFALTGREDDIVKVHGVRVELSAIEAILCQCTGVVENAMVVHYQNTSIVALVTISPSAPRLLADAKQLAVELPGFSDNLGLLPDCVRTVLREYCARRLPSYMVPKEFLYAVAARCFQTMNGKRNRKLLSGLSDISLLKHHRQSSSSGVETTPFEAFVSSLWGKRLGSTMSIKPWDSFSKLGGDSLDAQRVVQDLVVTISESGKATEEIEALIVTSRTFGEFNTTNKALSPATLLASKNLRQYCNFLLEGECGLGWQYLDSAHAATPTPDSNPYTQDTSVDRGLMEAAAHGYRTVVELFVNTEWGLGVDVDANVGRRNRRGKTPLHVAAGLCDVELVKILLRYGANVFATNEDKTPPIHVAAAQKSSSVVVRFLSDAMRLRNVPCPIAVRDGRRQTVLHAVARGGDPLSVTFALDELKRDKLLEKHINGLDRWNRTALHWATVNAHAECCRLLISAGADARIKKRTNKSTHLPYETPLQIAARKRLTAIVKIFTESIV